MADGPTILTASLNSVLPAITATPLPSLWLPASLLHTLHEVKRLHSLQTVSNTQTQRGIGDIIVFDE
jgi:hypothetical protein